MPNIAVVGMGNWGMNLVRVYNQLESLYIGCDSDLNKINFARNHYHNVKFTDSFSEILNDRKVDGIVISTPSPTHYELARKAMLADKAVYIEKPMTLDSGEAEDLVALAENKRLPLMVGHLLRYHPAVHKIKELIEKNELGDIYYIYSQRTNLGTIRKDENALWSFAPHDISVILYLLGNEIDTVSARGGAYLQKDVEDVVFLNIQYKDKTMANLQLSWLDPYKERKFTIVGSKKMVTFDDMQHTEKIRICDKGVHKEPGYVSYGDSLTLRFGDINIPKIDITEPLKLECQHFLECIDKNKEPDTSGRDGVKVVKILEKAQTSMQQNGHPVKVSL